MKNNSEYMLEKSLNNSGELKNFHRKFLLKKAHDLEMDAYDIYLSGNYRKAYECYKEILNIRIEQHSSPTKIAVIYSNLGICLHHMGLYKESAQFHQQALDIRMIFYSPKVDSNGMIAESYDNLGVAILDLGDAKTALRCFQNAFLIKKNIYGDCINEDILISYNELGAVARINKNYEEAEEYFHMALEHTSKTREKAIIYKNLGELFLIKAEYNKSKAFFNLSIILFEKFHDKKLHPDMFSVYSNLAFIDFEEKSHNRAILKLKKAIEIYDSYNSEAENGHSEDKAPNYTNQPCDFKITALYNLALAYFEKSEYILSDETLKEALKMAEYTSDPEVAEKLINLNKDLSVMMGDSREVINYNIQIPKVEKPYSYEGDIKFVYDDGSIEITGEDSAINNPIND